MKLKKKMMILIPCLFLMIVLSSAMVVTKPGEYKVIKQFGKIVRVEENDGSRWGSA